MVGTRVVLGLALVLAVAMGIALGLAIAATRNTETLASFGEYEPALPTEILDQMLRSQSNQLYIGPELERAAVPPPLVKRKSAILEYPVSPSDAAAMFALNLRTWRGHPFVRANVEEEEIRQLEGELDALRKHVPKGVEIVWELRQLLYERT